MATPKYLAHWEVLKVLEAAKRTSTRDWLVVLLGYRYGLRAQELASLTLESIKGGVIRVERLKGSDNTTDPITSDSNPLLNVQAVLSAYLSERAAETSQFLFVSHLGSGLSRRSVFNIFEDAAFHAGIEAGRRNPPILKHSLCVTLRKSGASIETIAKTVGHRSYETTFRYYAHVDRAECQSAVAAAFAQCAA
ncbi:MAG: tyrosine-type recombinase/integrase [Candidatus Acidiferrales bacterium]